MNTQTMSLQTSLQLFAQVNPTAFQELDRQLTKHLATAGASLTLEQINEKRHTEKAQGKSWQVGQIKQWTL